MTNSTHRSFQVSLVGFIFHLYPRVRRQRSTPSVEESES
jgi:hypothetical protein